jgi:hypothetical protein
MTEWLKLARDAAFLKTETFKSHAGHEDVMKRGILIFLAIALLVGIVPLISDLAELSPAVAAARQARTEAFLSDPIGSLLGPAAAFVEIPADVQQGLIENMKPWAATVARFDALKMPFPHFVEVILESLGSFISNVLSGMGSWMLYAVLVLLFAKWLGGKANIQAMLGTTALFMVPHVIEILAFIPILGGLLGLAAAIWGLIIYIKAVSVANELPTGKALLAVILPVLAFTVLDLILILIGAVFS